MDKLNYTEKIKYEITKKFHKCPWYKRIFKRTHDFTIVRSFNGIGTVTKIVCSRCKKSFDITDYYSW